MNEREEVSACARARARVSECFSVRVCVISKREDMSTTLGARVAGIHHVCRVLFPYHLSINAWIENPAFSCAIGAEREMLRGAASRESSEKSQTSRFQRKRPTPTSSSSAQQHEELAEQKRHQAALVLALLSRQKFRPRGRRSSPPFPQAVPVSQSSSHTRRVLKR